jgi:hypothetical protein
MQVLFEINLIGMIMEEYERRFLDLMRYVDFIKDENVKIQRFLSGMPSFYKNKIQYDDPRSLEESIRRSKCLYEKRKGRTFFQKA